MPPVEIEPEPSVLAGLRVAAHLGLAACCTVLLATQHLRAVTNTSAQPVPPTAQNTHRQRPAWRAILLAVFAVLAASSLSLATYSGISCARLSYRVWATERRVTEHHGDGVSSAFATAFRHLRTWLAETPLYRDAVEIIAEQARRLWWGQQLQIATAIWGVYLATEGRRRRIKNLAAYLVLAHLVSLSFAQNLFFIALLLAPTRAINEVQSNRIKLGAQPWDWPPRPEFLICAVLTTFTTITITPTALGTPWFGRLALGSRLLTFVPLLLPYILPTSRGHYRARVGQPYVFLIPVFRIMAMASTLLYASTTVKSLASNTPGAFYHRHSACLPFDTERRSAWDRSTLAFGRVLGSMADHPAVAAVGWDVIMSAVSIGIWAALRALGLEDNLCSVSFDAQPLSSAEPIKGKEPKRTTGNVLSSEPGPSTPAPRKCGRPRKTKAEPKEDPDTAVLAAEGDVPHQPTPSGADIPSEDEFPEEKPDWESAALAWGLNAVGGLGCAHAGVLGGDGIFF